MKNKVNQLTITSRAAGAAIAAIAIAGCGGNAASPPGAVTVVKPSTSTLQLAVGTANLFGTTKGLNVFTTLRTPAGKSVLVNTPTLTGPFVLPPTAGTPDANGSTIATGPSSTEIATGHIISATPQVAPGTVTIAPTTFGTSGGIFAGGFQPSNADNQGTAALAPYEQPNYNNADANAFVPIGGPPAFDPNGDGEGTRDGTFDGSVTGLNEGVNAFEGVSTRAGAYSETVLIPSNGTVQTTLTTGFTLAAATYLPAITAPAFVPDGLGGGTFAVTLPAGVTDGLLNIEDLGPAGASGGAPINCYTNGSYPAYFTIHVTGSGTYTLPDTDGVGSPTVHNPTICTAAQNTAANGGTATPADSYTIQLIGTDYPIYASNVLFTLDIPNPAIVGAGGSDDITISPIGLSPDLEDESVARRKARMHLRH